MRWQRYGRSEDAVGIEELLHSLESFSYFCICCLKTAELFRVMRHKLPDAYRRLAGYPRYAVCHAVKPTRPVQLSQRHQMFDQVLRHARLFQPLCPIVGRNVSVGDFTVQRFRILPSDPIHVLRTRTGEFVDPPQVWLRIREDRSDNARDISRRNWTGL